MNQSRPTAQELVSVVHNIKSSYHDAANALAAIVTKIRLGKTTWEELGTSYGSCYAHMRMALVRDTRVVIKKLREGSFEHEIAVEQVRAIIQKSLLSFDEIGTTLEEMIKFLS